MIDYIACGEAHSGAIDSEYRVFTWGAGSYGRLGHGSETDVLVPKEVMAFSEMASSGSRIEIKNIALGGFHSLFLQSVSPNAIPKLYGCGSGAAVGLASEGDMQVFAAPQAITEQKLFQTDKIVQIACGMFHSLALLQNGVCATWGVGANGRLGLGDHKTKNAYEPQVVCPNFFRGFDTSAKQKIYDPSEIVARRKALAAAGSDQKNKKRAGWEVKQISLGSLHSMVVTDGGRLYIWGCNANGQLGAPTPGQYQWIPRELSLGGRLVKEVAAGYDHCLIVTLMNELWAWGKGSSGQLGTGYARDESEPKRIENFGPVFNIAAGEEHSAAIQRKDRVLELYTWGSAERGMLGLGMGTMSGVQSVPSHVEIPIVRERSDKKAAAKALANNRRQSEEAKPCPLQVVCGQSHTMVIVGPSDHTKKADTDGAPQVNFLFTFGSGWFGKLGLGDDQSRYKPEQVGNYNPRVVSLGATHSAMITHDHNLHMWGNRAMCCEPAGQEHVRVPKKFTHIENAPKIEWVACGEQHTLVVTVPGDLYVWGDNKSGQLGLGVQAQPDIGTPELARFQQGAIKTVATGAKHAVAMFRNGEIAAWGCQTCGRLGLAERKQDRVVWEADKVMAVWASIESMSLAQNDNKPQQRDVDGLDSIEDEDTPDGPPVTGTQAHTTEAIDAESKLAEMLSKQKVTSFSTMQVLIKQEDRSCREEELQLMEKKLQAKFEELIDAIKKLAVREQDLNHISGNIEHSLKGNMKYLPKVSAFMGNANKSDPRIAGALPAYTHLFGILQQQVTYLAQLSTCLKYDTETVVFYRVVKGIFAEYHPRSRNLFLMLLRIMMDRETEVSGQQIKDVFSRSKSKVFQLFSDYALSERHYKDVMHQYLQCLKMTEKGEKETLIMKILQTSNRSEVFALSKKEYEKIIDTQGKQSDEIENEYMVNLDRFRDFLMGPFVEAIEDVDLPMDIRQLFSHALQAVRIRQFHPSDVDANVPKELRACGPLLRLLCEGVLIPLLTDTAKYATKEYYLKLTGETLKGEEKGALANMNAVARFIEHMINGTFEDRTHKVLAAAAKDVRPRLLKYIARQADKDSNIEVTLMMDAYMYHFERARHPVNIPTSDCLRLSNMLKKYMNKLRIKESDALEAKCRELPTWDAETIKSFETDTESDFQHNFLMKTRFMFDTKVEDIIICRTTRVPMPRELAGQQACAGLLQSFQSTEDSDNPRRALESLFRELENIESKTFAEMKEEFDRLRNVYRLMSPPRFDMVQCLSEGLRMVDELVNVEAHPEDVLEFMANSLAKRAKFRKYLMEVEAGLAGIETQRHKHEAKLKAMLEEYKQMHDFSLDLKLPQEYFEQEENLSTPLKFTKVSATMESQRALTLNPKHMQALGVSILPVETHPLPNLKKQGIIVDVHPQFAFMEKRMKVTFRALTEGGVELVVNVMQPSGRWKSKAGKDNTNAVKTLVVSKEKIAEMRRAEKTLTVELANPEEDWFLKCTSSKFCEFITAMNRKSA
jgi:alpha-tubulin suppressor-like RCC1 family protein